MAKPSTVAVSPARVPTLPLVHLAGGGYVPELGLSLGQGTFLAEQLPDGSLRLYQPPDAPVAAAASSLQELVSHA